MNKIEIGNAAGVVWRSLSTCNAMTYYELKDKCQMNDRLLNAAIGWLSREDKIEMFYDENRKTELFTLTFCNYYF